MDQIYIGNFAKGLKTNPLPFNIDNDAFPTLYNAYSWRGRVKRKRGTTLLGRLQEQIQSVLSAAPPSTFQASQIVLTAGAGNLLSQPITGITNANPAVISVQGFDAVNGGTVKITNVVGMIQLNNNSYTVISHTPTTITISVDSTAFTPYVSGGFVNMVSSPSIVPGSISVVVGANTYTDPAPQLGTLVGIPAGTGTINYATGAITITGGGAGPLTGLFSYYPDLPVLGLEDVVSNFASTEFPLLQAFDTTNSYQINQVAIPFFYSTNFYKNSNVPFVWSNSDDNQFWSTNYQSAFWVTNNKSGLHLVNGRYVSGTGGTTLVFTFTYPSYSLSPGAPYLNLVVGDILFFNEWPTTSTLNGMNGVVTTASGTSTYSVTFTTAQTVVPVSTGIAQLLTNSIAGQDGIKWYDGDPTGGTGLPTFVPSVIYPFKNLGWVNFSPPITAGQTTFDDQASNLYYLVGALAILPFKDRLLFFGPQIQTSSTPPIQRPIEDVVVWSWNGTPYYNSLVPTNQNNTETFDVRAYYVDQTGFGGYLPAGISQPIVTVLKNEDVLLIGFGGAGKKTRFVYTGNDLQPFLFYLINSELPSSSTFSGVVLDKGGIDIGSYGITVTTQQSCERIDLDIPDTVFEIQALNNGQNRVNAVRDFYREWIYFSYPTGDGAITNQSWIYPSSTLMWNYRNNTWAIFRENFTHHGTFRKSKSFTWSNPPFPTWAQWVEPWNSGSSQALFPSIIAGNPQGYVLVKGEGTGEGISGDIQAISFNASGTQITSMNHCVNSGSSANIPSDGDYLFFQDALGASGGYGNTIITAITNSNPAVITTTNTFLANQQVNISGVVGMTQINGSTYTIISTTPTTITINVDSTGFIPYASGGIVSPFNGIIGLVIIVIDVNNFVVDIPFTSDTYLGLGSYVRLSQPLIQTKQFPFYWDKGRQLRLGVQKYLMDRTTGGQVTLNINLSQDPQTNWNSGNLVPSVDVENNSLIYSQLMYTSPESTNLGLTPANVNLQMPTASNQFQIWHRLNTSLIGDSVQIGITLNDPQMRNYGIATNEIALHGIHLQVYPSSLLS